MKFNGYTTFFFLYFFLLVSFQRSCTHRNLTLNGVPETRNAQTSFSGSSIFPWIEVEKTLYFKSDDLDSNIVLIIVYFQNTCQSFC